MQSVVKPRTVENPAFFRIDNRNMASLPLQLFLRKLQNKQLFLAKKLFFPNFALKYMYIGNTNHFNTCNFMIKC